MAGDPSKGRARVEEEEETDDEEELLVEEREAEMVSFLNQDKVTKRKAWFLISTGNVSKTTPLVPSNYKNLSLVAVEDPRFQFKGWSSSPRQWEQWVAKLLPKYGQIWKKVGIFDAILISTYRIRRDPSSIFTLISHWCEETNTFLFPWGEVTVTLEDIIILSGLSVLGEPVKAPLPEEMRDIDTRLNEDRLKFNRSSSKKAHHSAWMKVFMERDGDELEHAAFLSLWLSRFVFPCHPEMTIRPHVFPIAIRLSSGQRIALAPSVLASIYRDLREMKRCLINRCGGVKDGSLIAWAPFHILQIWIWERFPGLRPETQNLIKDGEPRAARWHDVGKKLDPGLVLSVLSTPNSFKYRPYAISSSNWYKEGCDELIRDDELRSFAQCLCTCELVGIDTIEQYLPNRVAMQFGLDQDLPEPFSRVCNLGWEAAWRTYEMTADNIGLYVPPQPFEPGVTLDYLSWWREYMLACCDTGGVVTGAAMPQVMVTRENSSAKSKRSSKKARVSSPGDKKRKIQDCYDSTVSDLIARKVCDIGETDGKFAKGTKGAKSLNHHVSHEDMKHMIGEGSGSVSDPLNRAEEIMRAAGDSQDSGMAGDGKGVGFLEMKSITGDILKKVIKEGTAIKQEKVTSDASEGNQGRAIIDRSKEAHPSQQETVSPQPVSTAICAELEITPGLSDSNPQPIKSATTKVVESIGMVARDLNPKLDSMATKGEARAEIGSIEDENRDQAVKVVSSGLIEVVIEGSNSQTMTAVTTQVEAVKESEGGERMEVDTGEKKQGSHDKSTQNEEERERKVGEKAMLVQDLVASDVVNESGERNTNNDEAMVGASREKNTENPVMNIERDVPHAQAIPGEAFSERSTDLAVNEERALPVGPVVQVHPSRVREENSRERNPNGAPNNERELLHPAAVPVQASRDRSSAAAVHGLRTSTGMSGMDRYAAELRAQRTSKEAKELAEIRRLKQDIKDMMHGIMILEDGSSLP